MPDLKIKTTVGRRSRLDTMVLGLLRRMIARAIRKCPDEERLKRAGTNRRGRNGGGELTWITRELSLQLPDNNVRAGRKRLEALIDVLDSDRRGDQVRLQELLLTLRKQARMRAGE
jgi:hypothetical protein